MSALSHLPALLVLILAFFIVDVSPSQAQTIDELKLGVVKITATTAEQQQVGTGFIVKIEDKTAYIVTASHVVEGAVLTVNFFTNPDKSYEGTARNMQGGNPKGLAVITVQGPLPEGIHSLSLASNFEVKGGESVLVIGFRRSPSIPWGVLQGILTGQVGGDLIVSGAVANEGNSGGPILVNQKVVGVMTEVFDDLGYAVPVSIAQIILKGWGVRLEPTISPPNRVISSDAKKSDRMKADLPQRSISQDGAQINSTVSGQTNGTDKEHGTITFQWDGETETWWNVLQADQYGEYQRVAYTGFLRRGASQVVELAPGEYQIRRNAGDATKRNVSVEINSDSLITE